MAVVNNPYAVLVKHPSRHEYLLDGEPVPSVTEVITVAGLGVDYAGIDPVVLEKARHRGTRVHEVCEQIDRGQQPAVEDEIAPYRDAYLRFLADSQAQCHDTEARVYHPEHRYAGTYDWRGVLAGKLTILDRKATATMAHASTAAQAAGYLHAHNAICPDAICEQIGSLHLRRDGTYRLRVYELNDAWAAFLAALTVYRYRKRDWR